MAFCISFPLFPCLPRHSNPTTTFFPSILNSSLDPQKHEGDTKLTVRDRNIFINEIPQSDVCECGGKYKLEQMCLILLWNVMACSRNQQKKEDKSRGISISPELLSRYGRAQLLHANTKGLVKVAWILTGLKHVLVFQLRWLLGRLFKLLIRLCEHSGRPCWTWSICLWAQCLQQANRIKEWCALKSHDMDAGSDVSNGPANQLWEQKLVISFGL